MDAVDAEAGEPGEPLAAIAVEHAAREVDRRSYRWFIVAAVLSTATAAAAATLGLAALPVGFTSFAIAGRAMSQRRRAQDVARATRETTRSWSLTGRTVVGRDAGGAHEVRLALPQAVVRSLRALPAARVVVAPRGQVASATPPDTDR